LSNSNNCKKKEFLQIWSFMIKDSHTYALPRAEVTTSKMNSTSKPALSPLMRHMWQQVFIMWQQARL